MQLSPLLLERCYFQQIHIDATPEGTPHSTVGQFKTETTIATAKDQPGKWQVTLTVSLEAQTKSEPSTYSGELQVVGIFCIDQGYPEANREALISANAPAVLFSMARELIANLTARGPYPMVCLPTVTFVDQIPKPQLSVDKSLPAPGNTKTASAAKNGKKV